MEKSTGEYLNLSGILSNNTLLYQVICVNDCGKSINLSILLLEQFNISVFLELLNNLIIRTI